MTIKSIALGGRVIDFFFKMHEDGYCATHKLKDLEITFRNSKLDGRTFMHTSNLMDK